MLIKSKTGPRSYPDFPMLLKCYIVNTRLKILHSNYVPLLFPMLIIKSKMVGFYWILLAPSGRAGERLAKPDWNSPFKFSPDSHPVHPHQHCHKQQPH